MTAKERKLRTARLNAAKARWAREDAARGYTTRRGGRTYVDRAPESQLAGTVAVVGALALLVLCMALVWNG